MLLFIFNGPQTAWILPMFPANYFNFQLTEFLKQAEI